jgi:histidine triad (HIT) family protein
MDPPQNTAGSVDMRVRHCTSMDSCPLCRIVSRDVQAHVIAESTGALAFMDHAPAALGHALVVPKRHAADIWDLGVEDGVEVWRLTQRVARAARDAFDPDGLNLFQANGKAGWQSEFHFHIHVVPRWSGDALVPAWTRPPVIRPRSLTRRDATGPRLSAAIRPRRGR